MAGKRILVTGGGGFVGRNVLPLLLESGYDVTAISLGAPPAELSERCLWLDRDLLLPGACMAVMREIKPDLLLHLAWEARQGVYWTAESNLDWIAVSLELFRAFYASGGKRGVAAGTCAEYEWGGSGTLEENASPTRPATLYGTAKLAFSLLMQKWAQKVNVEFASGRIFYTFGPFESEGRLVPYVINSLLNGEAAVTSSGTAIRDYVSIFEVARAFLAILEAKITGPVNIGSGQGTPIADLIQQIVRQAGSPILWKRGMRPDDPGEPEKIVADISRLLTETSYRPTMTLSDSIGRTVAWWRTQRQRVE